MSEAGESRLDDHKIKMECSANPRADGLRRDSPTSGGPDQPLDIILIAAHIALIRRWGWKWVTTGSKLARRTAITSPT
jgi:hypothetical protein